MLPAETLIDVADVADLVGASFETLDEVFARGDEPLAAELDGTYRGRVLALAPPRLLPHALRRPLRAALGLAFGSPLFPWKGKAFRGDESGRHGADTWLVPGGPHLLRFRTGYGDGAIELDYDMRSNPPPIRGILGEIRRIAPGLYLGKIWLQVRERRLRVCYFTLDNA